MELHEILHSINAVTLLSVLSAGMLYLKHLLKHRKTDCDS